MNFKTLFRLFFHVFTTVMYFCAIVRYEYLPPMPHTRSHEHFAGRFKYLTYWNLIVQFVFFAVSCVIDLMKAPSANYNRVIRLRDRVYGGVVLPYGVFVFSMFWGLYAIDRELIFPRILDTVFPSWLNHVSHTVILPALLLETYILKHKHPRRRDGLILTTAFGLAYIVWVLYLGLAMDIWVYPILRILDWTQRFLFIVASIGVLFIMYIIGEKINTFFWSAKFVKKTK